MIHYFSEITFTDQNNLSYGLQQVSYTCTHGHDRLCQLSSSTERRALKPDESPSSLYPSLTILFFLPSSLSFLPLPPSSPSPPSLHVQVFQCLIHESELPVKVEAAVAMQYLIKHQTIAENFIQPYVKDIIQGRPINRLVNYIV